MIFKSLSKLGMERNFINLIKIICKMSVAPIILKSEILKGFFLTVGNRQICLLSPLLFNIGLGVQAGEVREEKELSVVGRMALK